MKKDRLKISIMFVITIAIFFLLFKQINIKETWNTIKAANLSWLFSVSLIVLAFPVLSAWRWQLMLRAMDIKIKLWPLTKIIVGSWPISTITPSKIGDISRGYPIRKILPLSISAGNIILERIMDVGLLLLLSLIGAIAYGRFLIAIIAFIGLIAILFFFLLASKIEKIKLPINQAWREKFNNTFYCSKIIFNKPAILAGMILITAINWLGTFIQFYLIYLSIGTKLPLLFICLTLPLTLFIGILPLTIAGMGTRDSAIIYFFSGYASINSNLSAGIIYSLTSYWLLAVIGLPFVKYLTKELKQKDDI